ncbi:hypothetical protein BD309DRAFT_963483 [Dichomitus squalens]|uniref:Uncharacterized protein n=1 Tax=Dichomitus squalens TaxID=114155 RepID=A0A4Q9NNJ9_9APHY|nr:hypothetical protein BD311DRAFT_761719 [Dichomitus squalens]TBU42255.1 hypothetical protein BD309DRAFT_963483 [Dichomitus squalens]TBU62481.1 hypothetical protein BD310DRAFT_918501 [Dichomitus squalens]
MTVRLQHPPPPPRQRVFCPSCQFLLPVRHTDPPVGTLRASYVVRHSTSSLQPTADASLTGASVYVPFSAASVACWLKAFILRRAASVPVSTSTRLSVRFRAASAPRLHARFVPAAEPVRPLAACLMLLVVCRLLFPGPRPSSSMPVPDVQ